MSAHFEQNPADVLARLGALREGDAPTHGGRVLSYVYDSGVAELDELAASAIRAVQPVNALDPTTFTSVAAMEREVIGFARAVFHGDEQVVGTVTSGGTESCLLAIKTARELWRADAARRGIPADTVVPRILAPSTVHAAFHKAADYFGLRLELVPVDPDSGLPVAADFAARLADADDVALVVLSAPAYPHGVLDPIAEVSALAAAAGVSCHVDACFGGFVLPWWPGLDAASWDLQLPGVTSLSADLHKYGYAPKGASVLLQRGRDRQRQQYFATTGWPGYPVVNSTLLGSKSAAALAAAWAITQTLGGSGFARLTESCARATAALADAIAGIDGLRVVGHPTGPAIAVAADESVPAERRVDPHHWADQARAHGWQLQLQPGFTQSDGTRLPATAHLTVTPVTESRLAELTTALVAAADEVRGVPAVDVTPLLASLGGAFGGALPAALDAASAFAVLQAIGLAPDAEGSPGEGPADAALPERLAPFLALVEALPPAVAEPLLTELIARLVEPA
ncbi:pyridoxal phosphate-dependent decarboxylase family protein [Microterricola viridarii]|uniref:Glutamate or tyrosine decarboxylase n=1 Tax=Microterricola viridarii TaxID=412690 RepID=A0A1H1RRY7_9MICO|nr:pyridoxal-dependent decarboxylase [Microterricola viridarii]SDS38460.1 Glutamate or tyrosine decarboxylase [Microterricola viridarii]